MQQAVQVARTIEPEARVLFAEAPGRLRGLDALRGLAALAVVVFHYTTVYPAHFGPYASRPLFTLPNGHFGVELFFCLSGFVILGSIERTSSLKRFALARFARIYPAYWVCALLSLAAIRLANFPFAVWNAKTLVVNATMLSSFNGTLSIDPSYWTLSYEVLFYAGAALVWSFLHSRGGRSHLELPCLLWLACASAAHFIPWVGRHHRLTVLLNVDYANLFVVGMMLYCLSQGVRSKLTIPTLAVALLMTLFPPRANEAHLSQFAYVSMILVFCGAIWLISESGGRFLDIRPLVFLGDISYSLYLIHQIAGFAILRALVGEGVSPNAAILTTITLMICIAFCLRHVVEKPAERWIKSFAKRGRAEVNA